ncbi:UDP-glucose/GDP-mannose dehydrogenase family protein [Candidatus Woesearchaeota archaeon]|nr:UDP-glucose/GDP-mannose dehydrogenase family protein [Candidatus Woesearchaeota archaeon]
MDITVIGTGYVGLTLGVCLASLGNSVTCVDIDAGKINQLREGIIPIYEPGLKDLLGINKERLIFTTDFKKGVETAEVIFLAVGTPSNADGSVDLQYVLAAAKSIGEHMNEYKLIVNKSTVPVGCADLVKATVSKNLKHGIHFDMASNPEFLREGQAIHDFLEPDRIVIGVETERAKEIMLQIYKSIEKPERPVMVTDVKSAELIKYASNAFLATKISFINEIARYCEKTGADVKEVAKGMGLDSRIGGSFLQAGAGYGGSCFPKDVKALMDMGIKATTPFEILTATEKVNEEQKKEISNKAKKMLGSVHGKKIGVWGLAFKPKTDDMREAPSLTIIKELLEEGANIVAFDPVAKEVSKRLLPGIVYAKTPAEAAEAADLLILITEWDEFKYLDFKKIKNVMKQPQILDARNAFDPKEMKELGFVYRGIGR